MRDTPKPTHQAKLAHQSSIISKRQAERMRNGISEGKPSDYAVNRDEDAVAIMRARHMLEDRRMMDSFKTESYL